MPPPSHPHSVLTRSSPFQTILFQLSFHPSGCFSAAQHIVSDSQPSNAYSPIEVTLPGITTLVSDEHPENAYSPIVTILFGITTVVKEEQFLNVPSFMMVILLGNKMFLIPVQSLNAYFPSSVIPVGIVTSDNELHPSNA